VRPGKLPRFRVYLAGPISGCNDEQRRFWRRWVREHEPEFEVLDPTDNLGDPAEDSYDLIRRDLQAIEQSDGVLVNMWKESIGSAIGVVQARRHGKVVVVADPNRLRNRMLDFYADAVVSSLSEAVRVLRNLLRYQQRLVVMKRGGSQEPFDRGKLVDSIRDACRESGRRDIVVPQLVLVHVIERLGEFVGKAGSGLITTTDIERLVLGVLEQLEQSEEHRDAVKGVAAAWRASAAGKHGARAASRGVRGDGDTHAGPVLAVTITSDKSHATIWGKTVKRLGDIPSAPARRVFETIMRVEGIRDIRLTKMAKGFASRPNGAELVASKTAGVIEGRLFDKGRKGNVQFFQIRVHDSSKTEHVRLAAESALLVACSTI